MAKFGIDRLEALVRSEMARRTAEPPPATYGDRLRRLQRPRVKGGRARIEDVLRTVLHRLRRLRSA